MYICNQCEYEFEEPEQVIRADPVWPWEGREWLPCCQKCESTDIIEVYHVGECKNDEC